LSKINSLGSEILRTKEYQRNWREYVDTIPKVLLYHNPAGKRDSGTPKKRWKI
jgi:hemerythrin superfamily protein